MISELLNVVPPPATPTGVASEGDWEIVERTLGVEFPTDLKELNRIYGTGWFDGFIAILSPGAKSGAFDLMQYTTEIQIIMEGLLAKYPELSPSMGLRLIPIGWTRNGDELFYLVAGGTVKPEMVIIESRGFDGTRYPLSLSSFLARVISRKLSCPEFSNLFASTNPTFHVERANGVN